MLFFPNKCFFPILLLILQLPDDPRLFVLEIGTEEMPPQDVVNASQQV